MLLFYLTLFTINLVLCWTILKVGHDSDEQMKMLMEKYSRGEV